MGGHVSTCCDKETEQPCGDNELAPKGFDRVTAASCVSKDGTCCANKGASVWGLNSNPAIGCKPGTSCCAGGPDYASCCDDVTEVCATVPQNWSKPYGYPKCIKKRTFV